MNMFQLEYLGFFQLKDLFFKFITYFKKNLSVYRYPL